jgi:hypothetical protein
MSTLTPSLALSSDAVPLGTSAQPDNMVMEAVKSSLPPMASHANPKKVWASNQAFAHMFLQEDWRNLSSQQAANLSMKRWLAKAWRWGFNIGQVLNAVQAAGKGGYIGKQFSKYLDVNFTNLALPGPSWSLPYNWGSLTD